MIASIQRNFEYNAVYIAPASITAVVLAEAHTKADTIKGQHTAAAAVSQRLHDMPPGKYTRPKAMCEHATKVRMC